ncbi:MAG: tagaturonate reductase, partial [Lachnospiraceae bacterium]|nr:tagaturonate reductase [Lachnospiraceae bacterium]
MDLLSKKTSGKTDRPIRVLQFGEGNFLRGFVDQMIDIANEKGVFDGDVVIVKPTDRGGLDKFKAQECQYTVILRGLTNGEAKSESRIVTCVADAVHPYLEYEKYMALASLETLRFVVSNTTEAGIVFDETDRFEACPPRTFPGKLCKFLYERYQAFHGDASKGLVMLPAELIDDNGKKLKECVLRFARLWGLETGFEAWLDEACEFASTLVDRIIAGYPKDEAEVLCKEF